jgi:hypothetical protein
MSELNKNWNRQTADVVDAVTKLRETLEKRAYLDDLKMVMRHLFQGRAQVDTDNEGQLVVYTGYCYGAHSEDVMALDDDDHGFPHFWCKND